MNDLGINIFMLKAKTSINQIKRQDNCCYCSVAKYKY